MWTVKKSTKVVVAPQSPVAEETTFTARSPVSSPRVTRSGRVVKQPAKFSDA